MRVRSKEPQMRMRSALAGAVIMAAAIFTGCTEGSSTSPAVNNVIVIPTPTPTPVPAPIGGSAVSISLTVAGSNQQFTVTENNYAGPLNAANGSPSCAGIATFAPASGTGPSATFTVTAVGAGVCTIVVTDNHGGSVGVNVTVTTTTGNINSVKRQPH